MMHAGPFVLYHLAQIRQEELDRRARIAWHGKPARPAQARPSRDAAATPAARLDAVAPGC